VVTTFARSRLDGRGCISGFPSRIQKVYKVDVNVFQRIELGYRTDTSKADG
jgi:hypothetical protein